MQTVVVLGHLLELTMLSFFLGGQSRSTLTTSCLTFTWNVLVNLVGLPDGRWIPIMWLFKRISVPTMWSGHKQVSNKKKTSAAVWKLNKTDGGFWSRLYKSNVIYFLYSQQCREIRVWLAAAADGSFLFPESQSKSTCKHHIWLAFDLHVESELHLYA